MKIADLSKGKDGSRFDLLVKVVEVVMSVELGTSRVSQVLVADETACVFLMVSGSNNVDAMVPGTMLQLRNVLLEVVTDHTAKMVFMLRLDRFAQYAPANEAGMLVKLEKNVSYTELQLVE